MGCKRSQPISTPRSIFKCLFFLKKSSILAPLCPGGDFSGTSGGLGHIFGAPEASPLFLLENPHLAGPAKGGGGNVREVGCAKWSVGDATPAKEGGMR